MSSSAAAGVSETIKLKDGTRINVREEILKDGSRRITREIIDVHGEQRVETESFRGPKDIDDESFLSLEEQRSSALKKQKHHSAHQRHNHGDIETASSSSGWESRMEDLTDDEGPGAHYAPRGGAPRRHHGGYFSGADTSTQTSGWISSELETKDTSTFNTLSDNRVNSGRDYDDGFALYNPRKYHASSPSTPAHRTYEDRLAFHAKSSKEHKGEMPPLPPRDMKLEKNAARSTPRSPQLQHYHSPHHNSSSQSSKGHPKSGYNAESKSSPVRSTHKSSRRDSPSVSTSSKKSGGRPKHQMKSRQMQSVPATDRFSRHVDNRKSEQMATAFSRNVFPDEESDLTDVPMDNDEGEKRGVRGQGGDGSNSKQGAANKGIDLEKKWCNKWVMIAICVTLIGAIAGLVLGWLVPMYTNKGTNTSSAQGNSAAFNQPTSAPTYELLEDEDGDFDSMGSPTINVPGTKTPSASPTIDPCSYDICTWSQIGRPLTGDNYGDGAGTSTAISEDGKILAVGGAGSAETGGFAKIFVRRGSSWIQRGQTIEGPHKYDRFGLSMSLSADGHTVAIGGDGWDGDGVNKGVVRVYKFKRSNSRWEQLGSDIEGDSSFDRVGWSVSLSASGRVLAFGAPNSDSGYTRVLHWNGLDWERRGGDIKIGDHSGHAVDVSADGHVLAVGSADGSYASVFDWNEAEKAWKRRGDVLVGRSRTGFGSTIKLSRSGEVVAVAAPKDGSIGANSGLVKVFYWNGMEWNDLGVIYGSFDSDHAGSAIDLDASGLKIAVGSPGRGVVDIYEWQGGTRWVSQRSFSADVAYVGTENRPVFSVALSAGAKFVAIGSTSTGDGGSVTAYHYDVASPSQSAPVEPTAFPTSRQKTNPTRRPVSSPTKAAPSREAPTRPIASSTTSRPSRSPTNGRPTQAPVTAKPAKPKPTAMPTRAPTTKAPTPRPTPRPTLMEWNQVGETIFGENSGEYIGTSTSLSARGNTLAMGGTWDGYGIGIVRVYARLGSVWEQLGQTLEGSGPGNHFGASVKLSNDGRTLVIGSDLDSDVGSIHVFQYSEVSSKWIQRGDSLEGRSRGDQAGWSVSMSAGADVIALGAPGSSAGYTRVYEWSGNRWVQRGKDIENGDRFGHSIDLSGDGSTLAVGAIDGSYVKVLQFNGSNWRERGQPIKGDESTFFGASVSLSRSGDFLAVGAPYDTRIRSGSAAGLARVYVWDNGRWVQQGQDLYGAGSFHYLGQNVALSNSGQVLAVGSPGPRWGDVPSSVLVYDWDGSARRWILRGNQISSGDSSSYGTSSELPSFSMSMSLNGNTVAVAAPLNGEKGRASGQVKVFQWPESS
jgi:hypothetical protein